MSRRVSMNPPPPALDRAIFPRCALLVLRAACRAFRAQLNNSRLWLPFTMELPRMR